MMTDLIDPGRLDLLRRSLQHEIVQARLRLTQENAHDQNPILNPQILDLEERLRDVEDAIWRQEDARVDEQVLAAYATTRATWTDVEPEWPLARAAWDREVGLAWGELSLLIHAGPPRQTRGGARLDDRNLLAVDESRGCRLRGPLDKSTHAPGCRCRLWRDSMNHWVDLAREGLVFNFEPETQVEGVVLGRGPDAVSHQRFVADGGPSRHVLATWLVRPEGRLPRRLLESVHLNEQLPGLVGQLVRISRLPNVAQGDVIRARYAIRPVRPSTTAPGALSWRSRRALSQAQDLLREDWGGAVVDGLRWIGQGDDRHPALSTGGAIARLSKLAEHAQDLLRGEVAQAIAELRDAVLQKERDDATLERASGPVRGATDDARGYCKYSIPFGPGTQKCACHGVTTAASSGRARPETK